VLNYKIATLDLSFVSGSNLQAILHDLDVNITAVWKNVGELQENIESITTGITKEGKRVEIEVAETKAMENLDEIKIIIEEGILGNEQ
jgi:EAL domain-containing protein (putative c-di-GMP-specific phosphodiesterase class I)